MQLVHIKTLQGEKFKAKTNKDVVVHVLLSQADAFVVVENQVGWGTYFNHQPNNHQSNNHQPNNHQ